MSASPIRKLTLGVASLAMMGAVVVAGPATTVHAASQTITLLNINDFHGRIDPTNDLTTKWATTIETQRALDPTGTLLLGAGDLIGASLFNSAVQQDQPTIDVLNELCLNASSVGNHEFDQGYADLTGRVINGTPGTAPDACDFGSGTTAGGTNARWAYLGANVYMKGTQTPALPEYSIFTVKGITIGVIGAVTGETPALVSPGGITQIDIGDPVAAVNRVADQLSDGNGANGEAQVLVAEYHEGAANGSQTLDQNLAAPPPNPFAEIVNGTSPKVDVIFTGHTHQAYVYDAPVTGGSLPTRPVLQTGNYADHVGQVTLTVDDQTGEVTAHTANNLLPAATANLALPRVAKVKTIVDAAKAQADIVGLQPVGTQTASITTAYTGGTYTGPGNTYVIPGGPNSKVGRDDRAKESTIGDLVANMLRDTLTPENVGGAEIGVANPGGLRDELFFTQTGTEGDGVITFAEANNVLPFVNNLWTTTLTGAQFKTLLEQQWQRDANGNVPTRAYLQLGLSDNVTYTYDDGLPEGSRITSITINGQPYDPAGHYRIGTFSFLATGGDNFRIFTAGTDTKDSGLVDRDGWVAYLGAHKPETPDFAKQGVKLTNLPTALTAGGHLQFGLAALDMTSLGSPANASVTLSIGGVAIGTAPVAGGAATVDVTIPDHVPCGAQDLTAAATPSGTTVHIPVTVSGVTACGLQVTNPPVRLLDTREIPVPPTVVVSGNTLELDVAGTHGIPDDAVAVAVNVTAVGATSDGWIRAYACDSKPAELTSNLNPVANQIVANLTVVPLDGSGKVCFEMHTPSDLVVDLQGWYPGQGDYHPIESTRIADTRSGQGIAAHLAPMTPVELVVGGTHGVPADASAVSLNLTAVASAGGYITAYPCGAAAPLASNLNTWAGHAIANSATIALGTGGKVCFVSNISTDLVVDLEGWFPAGAYLHSLTPVRALDTRETGPAVSPGTVKVVPITGHFGVPESATVVGLNVTAVNATGAAWVKVFPCGGSAPDTSNNNTSAGRIVATQALVPIGVNGAVCIATNSTLDIVVDVQGYQ